MYDTTNIDAALNAWTADLNSRFRMGTTNDEVRNAFALLPKGYFYSYQDDNGNWLHQLDTHCLESLAEMLDNCRTAQRTANRKVHQMGLNFIVPMSVEDTSENQTAIKYLLLQALQAYQPTDAQGIALKSALLIEDV